MDTDARVEYEKEAGPAFTDGLTGLYNKLNGPAKADGALRRVADLVRQSIRDVGIAAFPEDGEDRETLVEKAMGALRHAKLSGKNKVHYFKKETSIARGEVGFPRLDLGEVEDIVYEREEVPAARERIP